MFIFSFEAIWSYEIEIFEISALRDTVVECWNFEIFDFKLEDAEMKEISALARPDGRIVSPSFAPVWDKAA